MMAISRQQLWDMEQEQLDLEREKDPDIEIWRWSPFDLTEFERMLSLAEHLLSGQHRVRFCEAGCGIGTKLYLAKMYHGLEEVGYDVSDDYLTKAIALGVDARFMDFRDDSPPWEEFDIVYLSRPFKSDEDESIWEKSAWDGMKPGAVLMMTWASRKPYSWPCHYRAPFRGVWRKPEIAAPASAPVYDAMISRQDPYDPLVQAPGP